MKVSSIRKGVALLIIAVSAFGLGCELIVDFDRTKIPVEGNDGAIDTPDASFDANIDANIDTSAPDAAEASVVDAADAD